MMARGKNKRLKRWSRLKARSVRRQKSAGKPIERPKVAHRHLPTLKERQRERRSKSPFKSHVNKIQIELRPTATMFYKPSTRLLAAKFLGLFGGNSLQPPQDETIEKPAPQSNQRVAQLHANVLPSGHDIGKKEDPRIVAACSTLIAAFMIDAGIPGLTICVAKQGRIVWHGGFGYCDMENLFTCKPEARMRIASISKMLFAATVMAPLIERKKIDLKSSIHEYLSTEEFPKKQYDGKDVDITVEQLLSHTSGIRHYKTANWSHRPLGSPLSKQVYQSDEQYKRTEAYQRNTYRSVIQALAPFKDEPLVRAPGKFEYTTYGYTLLSAVAERAIQRLAEDDTAKSIQIEDFWLRVLREWGLKETGLDQDEPLMPNRARYYQRYAAHGHLVNAPYVDNSVKWAGGGLSSTSKDLVKFGINLIDSYKGREAGRLKRETIDLLWKEREHSYGLGFTVKKLDPKESKGEPRAIYHLGSAIGASSTLIIYPENEIVVAILANLGDINPTEIGLVVADEFANYEA